MGETFELAVDQIVASRWQPRERPFDPKASTEDADLVRSIRRHGVLTRLLVWQNGDQEWEMIAGHRRLAAAVKAGLETVPVEDVGQEHTEAELHAMVLVENLVRTDLTPVEEAQAYRTIMELEGLTQAELGEMVGCSQARISQRLGILRLAEPVQEMVAERSLHPTVARALVTVPDATSQVALAEGIVEKVDRGEMTTRKATNLIQKVTAGFDPEMWALPDGVEVNQESRNVWRAVAMLIEEAREAGTLGPLLLALYERSLMGPVWAKSTWEVQPIFGAADYGSFEQFMIQHGMTCATCTRRGRGMPTDGYGMVCDREVQTCGHWVGAEDPVRIGVDWVMTEHGPCAECPELIVGQPGNRLLCPDPDCYAKTLEEARQAAEEAHSSEIAAWQERARAVAGLWLEKQAEMDADHWLARPCSTCTHLAHGEHCEVARRHDRHGLPFRLVVAQNAEYTIPLCDQWQLKDMRLVDESKVTLADAILWLAVLIRKGYGYHPGDLEESLGIGHGNMDKLVDWLGGQVETLGQAATLLTMGMNQLSFPSWYGRSWGRGSDEWSWTVRNPFTGEAEKWALEEAEEMEQEVEE